MSKTSGQLLWNRMQITLPVGTTEVDTGLCQLNLAFDNSSNNEPTLGAAAIPADPADGSRVQVMPLSPIPAWVSVGHTEPFLSPVTKTVHVFFINSGRTSATVNVLFWDPATSVGPGEAASYILR